MSLNPRSLRVIRWANFFRFVLIGLSFLLCDIQSRAETSREYQLKAVFLFNFVQFTDWPTNSFTNSAAPIVIGILGNDPFGEYLEDAIRGEKVGGRKLEVQHFRRIDEIQNCQILFISQSESRRLERILQELKGRPILTVSDIDESARRGAMIWLTMENNRIRLRVNPEAAKDAGLELSSKLLRVADVAPEGKQP